MINYVCTIIIFIKLNKSYFIKDSLFDPSQELAIKSVLTREVSIIQGPPGTGKTFVGSNIVQMLLESKKRFKTYKGPIFIICYTNHALDQFLTHTLEYTQNVLRMGGRSKNPDLKRYVCVCIWSILNQKDSMWWKWQ